MATLTVQIADSTQRSLEALSEQTGKSVPEILDKAVEDYRRKHFFEGVDRDFATLKADPDAWAHELEERRLFDNTLMDGLDPDERWTEHGNGKD
ncbi:MAG: ribbon-helix-helix domain-containing protein [Gemmataceae bacterium]|nr:ribbon-helix-helix domain-containing protein [Gemmataceae bacterium]MCI0737439.1 ribbon-helix-helix domain-containing protein [Gemmataceae bacterium]